MNRVINLLLSLVCGLFLMTSCTQSGQYEYQTVPNDPMNVKIYTLPNGLKVYMTVNKEQPRIQTYIAVHTGSKNDPAETTGLAHYLEHLMFKGTSSFGTQDYAQEKPLLDTITTLFEQYRQLTDPDERRAAYHIIDSISGVASQYAIPNEYDKMMASIGANGSNAFTSNDVTCYTEDIPSNQIENWLRIESDRFRDPVFRLFHTELEAVYEEKNIAMANDSRKEFEAIGEMLFPTHPYGTQTTIGTQEHLKNPSIINIRNYFNKWYVPGNVAICLSGDFDPDQMIGLITRYFGDWNATEGNVNTPAQLTFPAPAAITEPQGRDILGQEAENVMMAWRFEGAASDQRDTLDLCLSLLSNGTAGLIDLDLNQQQRLLTASAFLNDLTDYSIAYIYGMPLPGQSLDDVRTLILAEVQKLADGDFDESLITSVMTEKKLEQEHSLENNDSRAMALVESFINGEPWAHRVARLDRMSRITKADVAAFASRHLTAQNYVYTNKLQGDDPNIQRIQKPEITPVQSNRDAKSAFLTAIEQNQPTPIEPVFIDYDKAITHTTTPNGLELLSAVNQTNSLFVLQYTYEMGENADKYLPMAMDLSDYIATSDMSAEEVKKAFYALGCNLELQCSDRRCFAAVSGLSENMEAATKLLDKVLAEALVSEEIFQAVIQAINKSRQDNKLSQGANYSQLVTYAMYGPDYIQAHTLTDAELQAVTARQLTDRLHNLLNLQHRVVYYGPAQPQAVAELIGREHHVAEKLSPVPVNKKFPLLPTPQTQVLLAPYTANNSYLRQVSCLGNGYDAAAEPLVNLYNEYFGGSMNAIVFQEMRETRGLAYNAYALLQSPRIPSSQYTMHAHIITQNDKLPEALSHFNEIIEQMPESESAFQNAKSALLSRLRTERTVRIDLLNTYLSLIEELGLSEDPRKTIFDGIQNLTLADLVAFQQQWIKGRHYNVCVLGDPRQVDQNSLRQMGEIKKLSAEEIFGY